jgi:endonuclease III
MHDFLKNKARKVIKTLGQEYPQAVIALNYKTNLELLIAVILSSQCTDRQVNKITPRLFSEYRDARDYAAAEQGHLEMLIRSAGFFRNKARHIISACAMITRDFSGKVPASMEGLLRLPGVARKTANVVLFNAFGINDGIAVDTHVARLSRRIGLSAERYPEKIEQDLMRITPKKQWGRVGYLLIEHGRKICAARNPRCGICPIRRDCDYFSGIPASKI